MSWAASIVATEAVMPAPLGRGERSVADWFRLMGRLQVGYRTLLERDPATIDKLAARVRRYWAELRREGIELGDVYLPLPFRQGGVLRLARD